MWNPSTFNKKRKQADDQRQPFGVQTQVRQRHDGREGSGACEMRRTAWAGGRHGSFSGSEPEFCDVRHVLVNVKVTRLLWQ